MQINSLGMNWIRMISNLQQVSMISMQHQQLIFIINLQAKEVLKEKIITIEWTAHKSNVEIYLKIIVSAKEWHLQILKVMHILASQT